MKRLKSVEEMPIACVIDTPGNSLEYETGGWRNYRPVRDAEKCTQCLTCWVYCPDGCIKVEDGRIVDVDLRYCKGCGICVEECPLADKALRLVDEPEEG